MRIAYLNPGGSIGGAEMCLLDLLAVIRASRPEVRASVLLGDDGPLRGEVESLGIPCEVLPMPRGLSRLGDAGASGLARLASIAARSISAAPATLAYLRRLRRRLRELEPDLVQSNGMKMHLLGAWTAPRGVPVVWHLHDYLNTRPAMARLLKIAARPGVEAVAVSRSVADDARAILGDRASVRTVLNAVDLDRFRTGPGDGAGLDREAGLAPAPEGTVRVGLVATFATWKGHDLFLSAAAQLPASLPVRFYVIGGPIYRTAGSETSANRLAETAERLGLTGRVGFVGHRADPAEVMRSLDVVVHASTRPEPFGRVIVEAMACGRALIAMEEGGAAELFRDGDDALGCRPRDPVALASAMLRLINDRALRERLGAAGRRSAVARFDRSRLADEWSPIYDRRPCPLPAAVAPRISP